MTDEGDSREMRTKVPRAGFGCALAGGCLIVTCGILILISGSIVGSIFQYMIPPIQDFEELPPYAYVDDGAIIEYAFEQDFVIDVELERLEIRDSRGLEICLRAYVSEIVVENSRSIEIIAFEGYGTKKLVNSEDILFNWETPPFPGIPRFVWQILGILGTIVLVFGGLVIIGAVLGYIGRATLGGILVIVFSALAFLGGGGFLIGSILGIIGGALILSGK